MRLHYIRKFSGRCCLAAGLAIPCLARALDRTWTDSANNGLWGTATNWSGNTLPGSTDNAIFTDPPGGGTVDLGAATRTINTLHFSNTLGDYTLSDGTLALSQIVQDQEVSFNAISAAITSSTLTLNVTGGELNVTGEITASRVAVTPSVPGGDIKFRNTSNAIGSISLNASSDLDAYDPGSLGASGVTLNGGTLALYSDISNANYGNNIAVTGYGELKGDINVSGPTSNVLKLGSLTMNSAAELTFQTRDNYALSQTATSISGSAIFNGTQGYLGEGPSQLILGPVSQTMASSSVTLEGIGTLVLNAASNYSGGTYVFGGMVVLGATGAAGSAAVNVYSGGTVDISAALASLPTLNIGVGGVTQAALAGNLTGAIYSGAGKNVFLSPGSIIAATAGPVPVRGTDVSSAAYYLGITSDTQVATVGDNGTTSIYSGAAFGLYTPSSAAFSGTISAAQAGQNLPIYISPGAQEFSGASFNTTDTTTGAAFFGPGEVVLDNAPGGSATVYSDSGSGASTQLSFLVDLHSTNTIAAGKKFNVSNGIFYPETGNAVANGGVVNINSGASLYLDPDVINDGPTTGTYNINTGGALYLAGAGATPGYGTTFTYANGALIIIGDSLSTGSPTFLPNNADIVLDGYGTMAITGGGIVLGNGHRLTTSADNSVTLAGGTGVSAAAGAAGVIITASASDAVLQINDPLALASTDLQIGDTNSFTTTSFTQRFTEPQNGTVILDNDSSVVKDLSLVAGTLVVGQSSSDHFSTGNYTQSGGVATFYGKLTLSGALTITAGTTHLAANLGAAGADSAASLSLSAGATLDIGDNTINLATATASAIRSDILAAYDSGKWDQPGLTSSLIPTHTATAIGYTTSGSSATIRLTWLGDANLDGIVNSADLSAISPTGTTWQTGDFNYDGKVNADDYSLFMLGAASSGGMNISTTLPEPGLMLGFIALCGSSLSHRRVRGGRIRG